MKYIEILSRNVYFNPDVEEYLKEMIDRAANANVAKWIKSNYRSWLTNKARLFKMRQLPKNSPKWLVDKFGKEDIFEVSRPNLNNLSHVIDYLNTLTHNVANMSVTEVFKQVDAWDEELKQKKNNKDGEIKVIKEYSSGYKWVQLLNEPSLKYEGDNMGHCVGGYWTKVSSGNTNIYSLRDKKNIPHVTVEYSVPNKTIVQVRAKGNTKLPLKYDKLFLNFVNTSLKILPSNLQDSGYIFIKVKGKTKLFNINNLPSGIVIDSLDIDFNFDELTFPDDLTIKHNLILMGCKFKSFPANLKVGGNLTIDSCVVNDFPNTVQVKGNVLIRDTKIKFPPNIIFNQHLDIRESECTISNNTTIKGNFFAYYDEEPLPDNLTVLGNAILKYSKCTSVGKNTVIKGDCDLAVTSIEEIPKDFKVDGNLNLSGSKITKLNLDIDNKKDLDLSSTSVSQLPNKIKCKRLDLGLTNVTKLPSDLEIEDLDISNTKILEIPNGAKIKQLKAHDCELTTLPDNLSCKRIRIKNAPIKQLPKKLKVSELEISFCKNLNQIPNDLAVSILSLYKNNVTFPSTFKANQLIINNSKIYMPDTLKVNKLELIFSEILKPFNKFEGATIDISNCPVCELPDNMHVKFLSLTNTGLDMPKGLVADNYISISGGYITEIPRDLVTNSLVVTKMRNKRLWIHRGTKINIIETTRDCDYLIDAPKTIPIKLL